MSQWRAFVNGGNVKHRSLSLDEVIELLRIFLLPPVFAASQQRIFKGKWLPPGPWDIERQDKNYIKISRPKP